MTMIVSGSDGLTFPNGTVQTSSGTNATAITTGVLVVANGGTNATSASGARTSLGLVIGTDVLAPTGTGTGLTALNGSNVTSGTVAVARLATTGTPSASTFLRGDSAWASVPSPNNGTLTMGVSGTGLSGSATFTADQSGASTFTVASNATSANTAGAIVARDGSGNFSAGTITATTFSGSGASLTTLNASNLSSGTVGTARLASGTANSGTYLRGDQTWASVSVSGVFVSQTWQLPSRSSGTTYTNSTGQPIQVHISFQASGTATWNVTINGVQIVNNNSGFSQSGAFIVPNGVSYLINCTSVNNFIWAELR
jgi:hypothetical protein